MPFMPRERSLRLTIITMATKEIALPFTAARGAFSPVRTFTPQDGATALSGCQYSEARNTKK